MDVELARQQWNDGDRRVQALRQNRKRYGEVLADIEAVVADLRRRVGQTFTLADLADAYDGADEWARELLDERFPETVPHEPGTVTDAAFHVYGRGASDYRP
jgi:glutathione S-transferase